MLMNPGKKYLAWLNKRRDLKMCPHSRLRPIYGDEIIWGTPDWNRLQCRDCGDYLRGSVTLAEMRKAEINVG